MWVSLSSKEIIPADGKFRIVINVPVVDAGM